MTATSSFTELTPFIAMLTVGFVDVYLVRDGNKIVLIDIGLPGQLSEIEVQNKNWDLNLVDISAVILTYAHLDHFGNAAEIQERVGFEVMSHQLDAPVFDGSLEAPETVLTERDQIIHQELTGLINF